MESFRIIIPAYNEAKRILPTLEAYCTYFGDRAAITVVTNGCTDDTAEVVRGAMKRFRNLSILDIPAAIGKGGAVRCGFMLGDEQYVGFVDADLSFEPAEFEKVARRCIADDLDCTVASRWHDDARNLTTRALLRSIASGVFRAIRTILFGLRLRDTQCGMKFFRRSSVASILDDLELANFAFDVDMLVQLTRAGARIAEVPVHWQDVAGTKVHLLRSAVSMVLSLLRLRVRRSFLANLPYVDFFGRQSVMPVTKALSLLVFCAGNRKGELALQTLVHKWRREGFRVEERACGGWLERFRVLLWYVFGTPRKFDAIVEMPGARSFLPLISAKPSFVVGESNESPSQIERFYRMNPRSRIVAETNTDDLFDEVSTAAAASSIYAAKVIVHQSVPRIVYTCMSSGRRMQQQLLHEAAIAG